MKRIITCNFTTSNDMCRGDTGFRPLINAILKRYVKYFQSILNRKSNLCYDAFMFESELTEKSITSESANFCKFAENFNLDIKSLIMKSKEKIVETCTDNYDRFWKNKIRDSGKAFSFRKFKTNISMEPHLTMDLNMKYKIAISRFRLSNHSLMIEKGRHNKPEKIERIDRKCVFCKNEVECEVHFLVDCPLYSPQRNLLDIIIIRTCSRFNNLNSEQKFIFIMSNENATIIKALGRYIIDSFNLRDKMIDYFF